MKVAVASMLLTDEREGEEKSVLDEERPLALDSTSPKENTSLENPNLKNHIKFYRKENIILYIYINTHQY